MKLFGCDKVKITGGYIADKQELNRKVTINAVYDRFCESGRIGAFDFDWAEGKPHKPHYFYDSDVAKWMEGAAYILRDHFDAELELRVERLIDKIEEHQGDDGYFNIYFTVCEPEKRFSDRDKHELYCAGHLFEAAVAYARATGKTRFLKCMERYADYIYRVFVTEKSAAFVTPGHEEIELALVEMYRYTKEKKYLELALFFLDNRGIHDSEKTEYNQSHLPVREQTEAVGHAVRALYLYSAMADCAFETGDKDLERACLSIYEDIVGKKMYVTGGLGSTPIGEAFTHAYDLPNSDAYAETCAGIGLMFFAKRLLRLENRAEFADITERVFYNGVLSGLSLDGKSFFYENPLEITLSDRFEGTYGKRRLPITQRVECFSCSCCPPNLNRLLPALSGYIYGIENETLFVNQFADSILSDGGIECSMHTDYPRSGTVKISARGVKNVAVRIPSWCAAFTADRAYKMKNGYAVMESRGEIVLEFDMSPFAVYADSRVTHDANRLCVQAGPVVYCAEGTDNCAEGENLHALCVPHDFDYSVEYDEYIGLNTLKISGFRIKSAGNTLYSREKGNAVPVTIRLVPYSAFANRGESDMLVWLHAKQ
ncbi:MAG: glycoside hydrolase family 127 protein [Clostridia bacterium]|nr:glycoside hydrolase family 127 protein [Clostridia bacterium]